MWTPLYLFLQQANRAIQLRLKKQFCHKSLRRANSCFDPTISDKLI